MPLKFAITDLLGAQKAIISDFSEALVTIPYNDSRTAEVTLPAPRSPDDLIGQNALPLMRMLKVWYVAPVNPPYVEADPLLVFWGPIINPTWTLKADRKTLRIEAHDMSIRLKHHYLSGADESTIFTGAEGQVIVSGEGLRVLRDAGLNAAAENTAGVPDLGIGDGTDTHPGGVATTRLTADLDPGDTVIHVESTLGFPDTGTDVIQIGAATFDHTGKTEDTFTGTTYGGATVPAGTDVYYNVPRFLAVQKGHEVWQTWLEIADDPFGPDFRLRPDDSTPGIYALLDTFDKRETDGVNFNGSGVDPDAPRDKRYSVIFQAGFGTNNVEEFTYAPQGDAVRNRAVVQAAHTAKNGEAETATSFIRSNLASRIKYGNYVYWEAAGEDETVTLAGKAEAQLLAYSEPPQAFSFIPRSDAGQRFIYGTHFMEGDVISCAAHFGGLRIWLPGFVSQVRLRQISSTGQTKAEVDAIPVGTVDLGDIG